MSNSSHNQNTNQNTNLQGDKIMNNNNKPSVSEQVRRAFDATNRNYADLFKIAVNVFNMTAEHYGIDPRSIQVNPSQPAAALEGGSDEGDDMTPSEQLRRAFDAANENYGKLLNITANMIQNLEEDIEVEQTLAGETLAIEGGLASAETTAMENTEVSNLISEIKTNSQEIDKFISRVRSNYKRRQRQRKQSEKHKRNEDRLAQIKARVQKTIEETSMVLKNVEHGDDRAFALNEEDNTMDNNTGGAIVPAAPMEDTNVSRGLIRDLEMAIKASREEYASLLNEAVRLNRVAQSLTGPVQMSAEPVPDIKLPKGGLIKQLEWAIEESKRNKEELMEIIQDERELIEELQEKAAGGEPAAPVLGGGDAPLAIEGGLASADVTGGEDMDLNSLYHFLFARRRRRHGGNKGFRIHRVWTYRPGRSTPTYKARMYYVHKLVTAAKTADAEEARRRAAKRRRERNLTVRAEKARANKIHRQQRRARLRVKVLKPLKLFPVSVRKDYPHCPLPVTYFIIRPTGFELVGGSYAAALQRFKAVDHRWRWSITNKAPTFTSTSTSTFKSVDNYLAAARAIRKRVERQVAAACGGITKTVVAAMATPRVVAVTGDGQFDASALAGSQATVVITRGKTAVDHAAEAWARSQGLEIKVLLPLFKTFGKAAPARRDERLVEMADEILWFGDKPEASLARAAQKAGKTIRVVSVAEVVSSSTEATTTKRKTSTKAQVVSSSTEAVPKVETMTVPNYVHEATKHLVHVCRHESGSPKRAPFTFVVVCAMRIGEGGLESVPSVYAAKRGCKGYPVKNRLIVDGHYTYENKTGRIVHTRPLWLPGVKRDEMSLILPDNFPLAKLENYGKLAMNKSGHFTAYITVDCKMKAVSDTHTVLTIVGDYAVAVTSIDLTRIPHVDDMPISAEVVVDTVAAPSVDRPLPVSDTAADLFGEGAIAADCQPDESVDDLFGEDAIATDCQPDDGIDSLFGEGATVTDCLPDEGDDNLFGEGAIAANCQPDEGDDNPFGEGAVVADCLPDEDNAGTPSEQNFLAVAAKVLRECSPTALFEQARKAERVTCDNLSDEEVVAKVTRLPIDIIRKAKGKASFKAFALACRFALRTGGWRWPSGGDRLSVGFVSGAHWIIAATEGIKPYALGNATAKPPLSADAMAVVNGSGKPYVTPAMAKAMGSGVAVNPLWNVWFNQTFSMEDLRRVAKIYGVAVNGNTLIFGPGRKVVIDPDQAGAVIELPERTLRMQPVVWVAPDNGVIEFFDTNDAAKGDISAYELPADNIIIASPLAQLIWALVMEGWRYNTPTAIFDKVVRNPLMVPTISEEDAFGAQDADRQVIDRMTYHVRFIVDNTSKGSSTVYPMTVLGRGDRAVLSENIELGPVGKGVPTMYFARALFRDFNLVVNKGKVVDGRLVCLQAKFFGSAAAEFVRMVLRRAYGDIANAELLAKLQADGLCTAKTIDDAIGQLSRKLVVAFSEKPNKLVKRCLMDMAVVYSPANGTKRGIRSPFGGMSENNIMLPAVISTTHAQLPGAAFFVNMPSPGAVGHWRWSVAIKNVDVVSGTVAITPMFKAEVKSEGGWMVFTTTEDRTFSFGEALVDVPMRGGAGYFITNKVDEARLDWVRYRLDQINGEFTLTVEVSMRTLDQAIKARNTVKAMVVPASEDIFRFNDDLRGRGLLFLPVDTVKGKDRLTGAFFEAAVATAIMNRDNPSCGALVDAYSRLEGIFGNNGIVVDPVFAISGVYDELLAAFEARFCRWVWTVNSGARDSAWLLSRNMLVAEDGHIADGWKPVSTSELAGYTFLNGAQDVLFIEKGEGKSRIVWGWYRIGDVYYTVQGGYAYAGDAEADVYAPIKPEYTPPAMTVGESRAMSAVLRNLSVKDYPGARQFIANALANIREDVKAMAGLAAMVRTINPYDTFKGARFIDVFVDNGQLNPELVDMLAAHREVYDDVRTLDRVVLTLASRFDRVVFRFSDGLFLHLPSVVHFDAGVGFTSANSLSDTIYQLLWALMNNDRDGVVSLLRMFKAQLEGWVGLGALSANLVRRAVSYGPRVAQAKPVGVWGIPANEVWVKRSSRAQSICATMTRVFRCGVHMLDGWKVAVCRSPMPMSAAMTIRVKDEDWMVDDVVYMSIGNYSNRGDYDGDTYTFMSLAYKGGAHPEFVGVPQLSVEDIYRSFTLSRGDDLRAKDRGDGKVSTGDEAYYVDHFTRKFVGAVKSLSSKFLSVDEGSNVFTDEGSLPIKLLNSDWSLSYLVGKAHGVMLQSDMALTMYLLAKGLNLPLSYKFGFKLDADTVESLILQVSEMYEVPLGGYDKGAFSWFLHVMAPLLESNKVTGLQNYVQDFKDAGLNVGAYGSILELVSRIRDRQGLYAFVNAAFKLSRGKDLDSSEAMAAMSFIKDANTAALCDVDVTAACMREYIRYRFDNACIFDDDGGDDSNPNGGGGSNPNGDGGDDSPNDGSVKVAVVGSRSITDAEFVFKHLDELLEGTNPVIHSGGDKSVDQLAEQYAQARGYHLIVQKADWERQGQAAEMRRNEVLCAMVDWVIAFWDGQSPGTKHMIELANKTGKKVTVIRTGQTRSDGSNASTFEAWYASLPTKVQQLPEWKTLSSDQKLAVWAICSGAYDSVGLLGRAGSGKSFVIKLCAKVLEALGNEVRLFGTTGVASCNIGGDGTINSAANLGVGDVLPGNLRDDSVAGKRRRRMMSEIIGRARMILGTGRKPLVVIIDEVSMATAQLLHLFSETLETAMPQRKIRYVLVGDFRQLLPVSLTKGPDQFAGWTEKNVPAFADAVFVVRENGVEREYTFSSLLGKGRGRRSLVISLTTNHRQAGGDDQFVEALNLLGDGCAFTNPVMECLLKRVWVKQADGTYVNAKTRQVLPAALLRKGLHIFTRNAEVDAFNQAVVDEARAAGKTVGTIRAKVVPGTYTREMILESVSPLKEETEVFKGMRFMIRQNIGENLANGTVGTVVDFGSDYLTLQLDDGSTVKVKDVSVHLPLNGKGTPVGQFITAAPGHGANALTPWKVQGLTIKRSAKAGTAEYDYEDAVVAHVNRTWRQHGLLYVVASRVQSADQLYILVDNMADLRVVADKSVFEFIQTAEAQTQALIEQGVVTHQRHLF